MSSIYSKKSLYILTFVLVMIFCSLLFACGQQNTEPAKSKEDIVEEKLGSMSLEEKVGQLFCVRPEALVSEFTTAEIENLPDENGIKNADEDAVSNLKKYHLGGLALFAKNIETPEQTTNFIDELQENSDIKLFFAIDEEGGEVARIANNDAFGVKNVDGGMRSIGKTGDAQNAFKAADNIGTYLSKYKFNLNFAPVCDVDPFGTYSKSRSFGSDPNLVADMAEQYIKGLHNHNIMATMKHFPGNGASKGDTHKNTVIVDKTWDELKQCDLIPFERAIKNNAEFAMIGHVTFPKVTGNNYPASLSKEIITNKLKGELGYKGIVVTDALAMKAVSDLYESDEACITALNAGVDVLLMPKEFFKSYNGVIKAVQDGRVSKDSLEEHVRRILLVKADHGLL